MVVVTGRVHAQARDAIENLKERVGQTLYSFKNKTAETARNTLGYIDRWQTKSSDKIEGLVDNMKEVHEFLTRICEFPTELSNLGDILGEWAFLIDVLKQTHPKIMAKLEHAIDEFAKPMQDTLKIVEQVRDVVGTLTKTAEQATSFAGIKEQLVSYLKGACADSRAGGACVRVI